MIFAVLQLSVPIWAFSVQVKATTSQWPNVTHTNTPVFTKSYPIQFKNKTTKIQQIHKGNIRANILSIKTRISRESPSETEELFLGINRLFLGINRRSHHRRMMDLAWKAIYRLCDCLAVRLLNL